MKLLSLLSYHLDVATSEDTHPTIGQKSQAALRDLLTLLPYPCSIEQDGAPYREFFLDSASHGRVTVRQGVSLYRPYEITGECSASVLAEFISALERDHKLTGL